MKDCTTEKNLYADIEFCRGKATKPGLKNHVLAIRKADIATFPAVQKDSATDIKGYAVIKESFVLAESAGFFRTQLVPKKNSVTGTSTSEWPNKAFDNVATVTMAGTDEEVSGVASALNNDDCIFLVPTHDGPYRLIGDENEVVDVAVNQETGEKSGDNNQTQLTLTCSDQDTLAPFYYGDIKLLDGTILNGETGAVKTAGS